MRDLLDFIGPRSDYRFGPAFLRLSRDRFGFNQDLGVDEQNYFNSLIKLRL